MVAKIDQLNFAAPARFAGVIDHHHRHITDQQSTAQTDLFDARTGRQSAAYRLQRPQRELQIFQYIFTTQARRQKRMTPRFQFPAIVMKRQHTLPKHEPNQVNTIGIDFERGIKLIDPIPPLHCKVLLQTH